MIAYLNRMYGDVSLDKDMGIMFALETFVSLQGSLWQRALRAFQRNSLFRLSAVQFNLFARTAELLKAASGCYSKNILCGWSYMQVVTNFNAAANQAVLFSFWYLPLLEIVLEVLQAILKKSVCSSAVY